MELPEGFSIPGKVVKLLKALYGLKQGPRCWWLLVTHSLLKKLRYNQCVSDGCFFWREVELVKPDVSVSVCG